MAFRTPRRFTPVGTLYSYFDSSFLLVPLAASFAFDHASRTHEVDQPTNRLPHRRAFRGRPSRRSQSVQCKGEHGQQQPCNVHPARKSTTSTCSGAIPRGKVCSATHTHRRSSTTALTAGTHETACSQSS